MHPPVGAERWAALRALREGENPTFARLAAAAGLHIATLRDRASRDSWAKRHFPRGKARDDIFPAATAGYGGAPVTLGAAPMALPDQVTPEAGAADAGEAVESFLVDEVEGIVADARSGRIDKTRIEAVLSMIRMVERTEQFRRAPKGDEANEKKRSDDELAELLARIDRRIVELALCHAERLGRRERSGGAD